MENNRKILDEIIKNIYIPVYEVSYKEYFKILEKKGEVISSKKHYYYGKNKGRKGGIYHNSAFKNGSFIFIYKYLRNSTKIWVLLHEYKHYIDEEVEYLSDFGGEYYAEEYALKECFKNKYLTALYNFMWEMDFVIKNETDNIYKEVFQKIMKLELYENCVKLLKENNYDISFKKKPHLAKL